MRISLRRLLLISLLSALAAKGSRAQLLTTESPYSRYAVGIVKPQAYASTLGWGGVTQTFAKRNVVNPFNPASYAFVDSMTFVFDMAFSGGFVHFKTPTGAQKYAPITGIDHLTLQFPVAKWGGMAAGFQPYSNIGYDITRLETNQEIISEIGQVRYRHKGHGGLNEAFLGFAATPVKYIALGINAHFRFGSLNHRQDIQIPGTELYSSVQTEDRYVLRGLMLRAGVMGFIPLDTAQNRQINLGFSVEYSPYMKATNWVDAVTRYANKDSDLAQNYSRATQQLKLPYRMGGGIGYKSKRFMAGAEGYYEPWADFTLFTMQQTLHPSWEVRAGVQFTPDYADLRHYYNRMGYSLGLRIQQLPMRIENHSVRDLSLSLGLCFPFGYRNSTLDLALLAGRRGGFGKDIVNETYCTIHFGVSFTDFWFFKRKYN